MVGKKLVMTLLALAMLAAPGLLAACGGSISTATPEANLGDTWTRPADGMVMVYVPGGEFQMGSSEAEIDAASELCEQEIASGICSKEEFGCESPQHTVTLDAFWIDRTEVTNAQYALCVADGDCEASSYTDDVRFNGANYPVGGVRRHGAEDYCAWAGARLPTEAEWEYAARGPDGYDAPTCELAQFRECSGVFSQYLGEIVPVDSLPDGASWCGALGMAGNAWEWVSDWYANYPSSPQTNPTGPPGPSARGRAGFGVFRGGSSFDFRYRVRSAFRGVCSIIGYVGSALGFRCGVSSTSSLP